MKKFYKNPETFKVSEYNVYDQKESFVEQKCWLNISEPVGEQI